MATYLCAYDPSKGYNNYMEFIVFDARIEGDFVLHKGFINLHENVAQEKVVAGSEMTVPISELSIFEEVTEGQ